MVSTGMVWAVVKWKVCSARLSPKAKNKSLLKKKKTHLIQIPYLSVCVNVTPFTTFDALDITYLKKRIVSMYVNATGQ